MSDRMSTPINGRRSFVSALLEDSPPKFGEASRAVALGRAACTFMVDLAAGIGFVPTHGMPAWAIGASFVAGVLSLAMACFPSVMLTPVWYLLPALDCWFLSLFIGATGGASSPYHWIMLAELLVVCMTYGPGYSALLGTGLVLVLASFFVAAPDALGLNALLILVTGMAVYVTFSGLRRTEREVRQEAWEEVSRAEELRALTDAKLQFINIASHELRTPLSVIKGYARLLQRGLEGAPHEDLRDFATEIVRASERMRGLIEEFLDFGRLQSGQLPMVFDYFDLERLSGDVVRVLGVLANEGRQELRCELQGDLKRVWGDARRIEQVVLNLMHNALKYSPQGSVVRLVASRGSDGCRIDVIDEGPGVPAEHEAHLFSPFFRAGAEHTGVEGIGLGLAICRAIAQAHGGTIDYAHEPENGTIFTIQWPAEAEVALQPENVAR